jgi:hypothetical protein
MKVFRMVQMESSCARASHRFLMDFLRVLGLRLQHSSPLYSLRSIVDRLRKLLEQWQTLHHHAKDIP